MNDQRPKLEIDKKIDLAEALGIINPFEAHRVREETREDRDNVISQPTVQQWIQLIQIERGIQIEHGYTAEHDDEHGPFHLLNEAVDYARRNKPVESSALIVACIQLLQRAFAAVDDDTPAEPTPAERDAAFTDEAVHLAHALPAATPAAEKAQELHDTLASHPAAPTPEKSA